MYEFYLNIKKWVVALEWVIILARIQIGMSWETNAGSVTCITQILTFFIFDCTMSSKILLFVITVD